MAEAAEEWKEIEALAAEIVRVLQTHPTFICSMALARAYGCLLADVNAMIETEFDVALDLFVRDARQSFLRHRASYIDGPKKAS